MGIPITTKMFIKVSRNSLVNYLKINKLGSYNTTEYMYESVCARTLTNQFAEVNSNNSNNFLFPIFHQYTYYPVNIAGWVNLAIFIESLISLDIHHFIAYRIRSFFVESDNKTGLNRAPNEYSVISLWSHVCLIGIFRISSTTEIN